MSGHASKPVPGKIVFAGLALLALGIAVAVFLAIGLFGSADPVEETGTGVANGEALAEANCARCHAIGAQGESPNPDAPPFRGFKDKWPVENLEEALAEGIVTSHDNVEMPEFEFEADQIGDFIAYLKTL